MVAVGTSSRNGYVLAFDVAGFVQPSAERGYEEHIRRRIPKKPDHRHSRLLRLCRKRPSRHRAAEKRDEFTPLHVPPQNTPHPITSALYDWMVGKKRHATGCRC
jgi:hypothetical protein